MLTLHCVFEGRLTVDHDLRCFQTGHEIERGSGTDWAWDRPEFYCPTCADPGVRSYSLENPRSKACGKKQVGLFGPTFQLQLGNVSKNHLCDAGTTFDMLRAAQEMTEPTFEMLRLTFEAL